MEIIVREMPSFLLLGRCYHPPIGTQTIKRHSTQSALESLVTDAHYFWKHHKIKSRDVKTFGQNLGGQNISADKIFGGQKFSAGKIFGTFVRQIFVR